MKLTSNLNLLLLAGLSASPVLGIRGGADAMVAANEAFEKYDRSLQEIDTIVIGRDSQTVSITVDQDALNGLASYGEKFLVLTPIVCGSGRQVKCTATMVTGLTNPVNMQFFLRKALNPDKDGNGEAKDFDCGAMDDNDFISPDVESCAVGNIPTCPAVDAILGYISVIDTTFNKGATYTVNFVCEIIEPPEGGGGACFSEDSTTTVLGKGPTVMKDLQVGDKVFTGSNYEPVYGFAHLDKTTSAPYLQIHTENQKDPLEVSKEHLLLVNDKYVPAGDIKVGDYLSNGAVEKIKNTKKTGLYAPLTPSGTMVVNGVQTSNYISIQQKDNKLSGNVMIGENNIDTGLSFHLVNHMALSPIRMTCMGISSRFCDTESINEETGYPVFVSFWFQLMEFFQAQSLPIQIALVGVFFCVVAPFYAAESLLLGPAFAPTILLGIVAVFFAANKQRKEDNNVQKIKQV